MSSELKKKAKELGLTPCVVEMPGFEVEVCVTPEESLRVKKLLLDIGEAAMVREAKPKEGP